MTANLVQACMGKKESRPAFWFMRQAGRYLSEYREVRKNAGGFLDLCYDPEKAAQVTLQPVERFGMDAAIIFSDILVVPQALGADLRFAEGEGPVLAPVNDSDKLAPLKWKQGMLEPVYEALRLTRAKLPEDKTLIGFAGAPWTLACYMVQGKSDREFYDVRRIAQTDRKFFLKLVDMLSESVYQHLVAQIDAGAQVVQIFDSWAGICSATEFDAWVIAPTQKIVQAVKKARPGVPVIGFPRLAGMKYRDYAAQTGVDVMSVDYSVPLEWVKKLQDICVVQGNLDPLLLADDKAGMLAQAGRIVDALGHKPFVFNLGHGILPHTPVENMQALCEFLRKSNYS